jgi:hypothetical protein
VGLRPFPSLLPSSSYPHRPQRSSGPASKPKLEIVMILTYRYVSFAPLHFPFVYHVTTNQAPTPLPLDFNNAGPLSRDKRISHMSLRRFHIFLFTNHSLISTRPSGGAWYLATCKLRDRIGLNSVYTASRSNPLTCPFPCAHRSQW